MPEAGGIAAWCSKLRGRLLQLLRRSYVLCVLILPYMCPHTALYVSSGAPSCAGVCCSCCGGPHTAICVLILLCMCPQVLQVARAFVAAVAAQHSLRLALGRFVRVHAAGDGEGEEGGHGGGGGGGGIF